MSRHARKRSEHHKNVVHIRVEYSDVHLCQLRRRLGRQQIITESNTQEREHPIEHILAWRHIRKFERTLGLRPYTKRCAGSFNKGAGEQAQTKGWGFPWGSRRDG